MSDKALITGITGQDGSFLAEILIDRGYEVHGLVRRSSNFNTQRIDHLYSKGLLTLHYCDITDPIRLTSLINHIKPDEIYHLAAQSHVAVSFDMPSHTADSICSSIITILEAICYSDLSTKLYNASSSEMFGNYPSPQNEDTPFDPQSPYACAKVFAHNMVKIYRDAYGIFACNGILFNHESERRGNTFVTQKIVRAAVRIKAGLQDKLYLGNIDAQRDWGYAKDYCEAMHIMLQQNEPDDYVIATGETHTVKEVLDIAFGYQGMQWQDHVVIDGKYERPCEVDCLQGDYSKAHKSFGWEPKVNFCELIKLMLVEEKKTVVKAQ